MIKQQEAFSVCMQQVTALMPTANQVCTLVAKILVAWQSVRQQFQLVDCSQDSKQDIQTQLDTLLYAGFLTRTPYLWLQEIPRYFRALTIRLEKLTDSPAGDEKKLQLLRPFLQEHARLQKTLMDSAESTRLRWMLEEYRVSLFAQPMKTAIPVSPKRIEKQIALCV